MKKTQLNVFFFVGIVVIIIVIIILSIEHNEFDLQKIRYVDKVKEQAKIYLENCMEDISRDALFNEIASNGGYPNQDGSTSSGLYYALEEKKIYYWNDGTSDISPSLDIIEENTAVIISKNMTQCFTGITALFSDLIIEQTSLQPKDIEFKLNEDNIDIILGKPIKITIENNEIVLEEISSKIEYNTKRDFELAKKILYDTISAQPNYYDILANCYNYTTNGKTNVFTIDVSEVGNDSVTIVSIIDYEPFFRDNEESLRINFALKNIKVMGYCSG